MYIKSVLMLLIPALFLVSQSSLAKDLKESEVAIVKTSMKTFEEAKDLPDLVNKIGPRLQASTEKFYREKIASLPDKRMPKILSFGHGRFAFKLDSSLIAYEVIDMARGKFLINNKPVDFLPSDTGEAVFKKVREVMPETIATNWLSWLMPAAYGSPDTPVHAAAIISIYRDEKRMLQDCAQIGDMNRRCDFVKGLFEKDEMKQKYLKTGGDPNTQCSEAISLMEFKTFKDKEYEQAGKAEVQSHGGEKTQPKVDGMRCVAQAEKEKAKAEKKKQVEPGTELAIVEKKLKKKDDPDFEKEVKPISYDNVSSCTNQLRDFIESDGKEKKDGTETKKPKPFFTTKCVLPDDKPKDDKKNPKTPTSKASDAVS